ncbi:peroxiredoxin family protein [Candidatus Nitrosocosmicus arcticus]|uniref:Alkyl hydroperoxide reductase/Thiol spific antioxidant family protein n=1 Tax=Candidatus Nitrosocosmicus arcticus TaxID=2035267 RepID=A0A557STI1_9ARCH|nr:TlpA disulfide reductase family protein [Candidatus Nitrosocosmicus arcticus]TVP39917.1 alkyl hydroperoxide reductase/Thiol spific antioxidant family protein [Candidatus Nitrosocosmicus arcticus]
MAVEIGSKAPNLQLSKWVQGTPTNMDDLVGNVVVIEVFQVNCPGCFLYGIPQAVSLYEKYEDKNVKVIGVATAFEDYDKNTLQNLELLLSESQVIGETFKALKQHGKLINGNKLYYQIPFPVAFDKVIKMPVEVSDKMIFDFIEIYFSDFSTFSDKEKKDLIDKVRDYLQNKKFSALTFETYRLRGTPSSIVIDKEGILRYSFFGSEGYLEGAVNELRNVR